MNKNFFRPCVLVIIAILMILPAIIIPGSAPNSQSFSSQTNNKTGNVSADPTINKLSTAPNWQTLGPAPISTVEGSFSWGTPPLSGRVTSLAVNGSNPSEIYLGAAGGGVWKTLNAGNSWSPLTDNQSSLSTGIVVLSPDNSTIYVGTGEANHKVDNNAGMGLLRSTDEGKTWQLLGANYFNGSAISGIVINKNDPKTIIVSTTWAMTGRLTTKTQNSYGIGIFVSHDGGTSWSMTLNPQDGQGIASLCLETSNNSIVYAGSYSSSVWFSKDNGSTWNQIVFYSQISQQGRTYIAVQKNMPNSIYVASIDSIGNVNAIFRYNFGRNSNVTMSSLPPRPNDGQAYGPCNHHCQYSAFLEVDPSNQSVIYFGGIDVYRSNNAGFTWTDLGGSIAGSLIHPDQHALAFDPTNPSVIYNGNDGGVWKSNNQGTTWINLNTNLSITEFDSIAVNPNTPNEYIGGTQDNGCNKYNGSTKWTGIAVSDGGWTGYEASYPDVMYCFYVNLYLQTTFDGGNKWNFLFIGSENSLFYVPVVQDTKSPGTLYAAGYSLYKSTDFGQSWSAISSVLTQNIITALAIDPTNNNTLYAGDQAGTILKSTDGGINWQNMFNSTVDSAVTSIKVNPIDNSLVYASFASFSHPLFYTSSNGGTSWIKTDANGLPNRGINVIKVRNSDGCIYIGTDSGVYYSIDQGKTWSEAGNGLPNVVIWDLAFDGSSTLVAATFGRGVWRLKDIPQYNISYTTNSKSSSKSTPGFDVITLVIIIPVLVWKRKIRKR